MCYDVQNFDFSKGNSSFLELFRVIFILWTIAKILFYHQGILSFIEGCVNPILPEGGGVKKHRTTMDPSAVSEGQGQGSPKFLTLFLSISDMSQGSHFWNFYLKILEN